MQKSIILFDGVCNLCNSSVNFIIDRDPENHFVFAPLQGNTGQELQKQYGLNPKLLQSVILIKNGKVYKKSNAALEIAKDLKGAWKLLFVLKFVPSFLRNWLYNLIVRNRYKWFGKTDQCRIPTEELIARFI
jgi:predicted DCC family thiol-disulfide oxidoreductase YuxK